MTVSLSKTLRKLNWKIRYKIVTNQFNKIGRLGNTNNLYLYLYRVMYKYTILC
jgi:hypothetical protein